MSGGGLSPTGWQIPRPVHDPTTPYPSSQTFLSPAPNPLGTQNRGVLTTPSSTGMRLPVHCVLLSQRDPSLSPVTEGPSSSHTPLLPLAQYSTLTRLHTSHSHIHAHTGPPFHTFTPNHAHTATCTHCRTHTLHSWSPSHVLTLAHTVT